MYGMKMFARPEYLRGLTFLSCDLLERTSGLKRRWFGCGGEAGSPVTVVSLPARGRPPEAAARRAGLEVVEKVLTDSMVALLDGTEREHATPRPARRNAGRAGYWLWLRVALIVVAVAQRRLGPSSSAMTSTVDRTLPSWAVQLRCWSRPTTTTRSPRLCHLRGRESRWP